MKKWDINISYRIGDSLYTNGLSCEHYYTDINYNDGLSVKIHPNTSLYNLSITAITKLNYSDIVYTNGLLTGSQAREYNIDDRMDNLVRLPAVITKKYGYDTSLIRTSKRGIFVSYGLTYLRKTDNERIDLFASTNEYSATTIFYIDCASNTLTITRDWQSAVISSDTSILDITEIEEEYYAAFDIYRRKCINTDGVQSDSYCTDDITYPPKSHYLDTYTAHRDAIDEEVVMFDCRSALQLGHYDCILIGGGFAHNCTDWSVADSNYFPSGLKNIADSIHDKGLKVGLRISPTLACRESEIASAHPDWLISDSGGQPITLSPKWGGSFGLDITVNAVSDYLSNMIYTLTDNYGYDLLILDDIYTACLPQNNGHTRMSLLKKTVNILTKYTDTDKLVLSGVPISLQYPAAIQISPNCNKHKYNPACLMTDSYDNTRRAILSTLFRRYMSGSTDIYPIDTKLLPDELQTVYDIIINGKARDTNMRVNIYKKNSCIISYICNGKKVRLSLDTRSLKINRI